MNIKKIIAALTGLSACLTLASCAPSGGATNEELWREAMTDAVFSEDEEIHDLVKLTAEDDRVIWDESNTRVLLLTWHNYAGECEPGGALGAEVGEIWATSVGEMIDRYEASGSDVRDWELWFAQKLGVHEDEGYTRFTAFWVSPEDVIRPAYITDVTADMVNDYSAASDPEYKEWFDGNIIYSYFESDYPWTRLGYTYDWSGGGSEYGLTEFLIFDGSKTEIEFTYTTDEFVDWLAGQANA